jgi:glycosyltransferase involved in cell wall biosynthesis
VIDGETGYLTAAGDGEMLAARILELLDDPGRARAMGAEARRRVSTGFSPTAMADSVASLYGEILARRVEAGR